MSEGQDWDSIPVELVEDCAQLTKANSIEGKMSPACVSAINSDECKAISEIMS